MATLRNKRKSAAVTRETQEENPRNGQSRNTPVPRSNEENITQVFEQIEGRVTEKLSQEFSRTESLVLGALPKLDEFLLNQQITTHSGTVPGLFRNTDVENQGTNGDDSQSDPHPEAGIFRGQNTQNFGPKDCRDKNAQFAEEPNEPIKRGSFFRNCGCRSTSAKPAVRQSPQQRTPQFHQTGIRQLKLTYEL